MTRMEKQMAFRAEMNRRARRGKALVRTLEITTYLIGYAIIGLMLIGLFSGAQNWSGLFQLLGW